MLDDDAYLKQLWSLGKSYAMLQPFGCSESLLNPLVVAQVRGSVAATGGHEPEKILRQLMAEWGLTEGTDFNAADVKLNAELHIAREVKQGGRRSRRGPTISRGRGQDRLCMEEGSVLQRARKGVGNHAVSAREERP